MSPFSLVFAVLEYTAKSLPRKRRRGAKLCVSENLWIDLVGVNTGGKSSFPVDLEGIPPLSRSLLLLIRRQRFRLILSFFHRQKPFLLLWRGFLGFSSLMFLKFHLDMSRGGPFIVMSTWGPFT